MKKTSLLIFLLTGPLMGQWKPALDSYLGPVTSLGKGELHLLLCVVFWAVILVSCQQTNSPKTESGLIGQIYEVGSPAEPADWTPPALKGVRTIIVSDSNDVRSQSLSTDSLGKFNISLLPGIYFLLVKDATRPQEQNGPFNVVANQIISVRVYHDNGIR